MQVFRVAGGALTRQRVQQLSCRRPSQVPCVNGLVLLLLPVITGLGGYQSTVLSRPGRQRTYAGPPEKL